MDTDSQKDISEFIEKEDYHVMSGDVMVCCLTMVNGIIEVGFVVFDGVDRALARSNAKFDAIEKIWNKYRRLYGG